MNSNNSVEWWVEELKTPQIIISDEIREVAPNLVIWAIYADVNVEKKNDYRTFTKTPHAYNYSEKSLNNIIEKNGYEVIKCDFFGAPNKINGGINKNGVYSIKVFIDDELKYSHELESFSFDETRYINSLIDYKEYKDYKRRIQKTFIEPNNRLSIYSAAGHNNIEIDKGKKYEVSYAISDIAGNTSNLIFWIKGTGNQIPAKTEPEGFKTQLFSLYGENSFTTEDLILNIPGKALYDSFWFNYKLLPQVNGSFSKTHQLHFDYVPIHTWCSLSIRADFLEEKDRKKALIAKIDDDGEYYSSGGKWDEGFITTSIREFGNYCILVDTVPPKIKPLNISNKKSLLKQTTIKIKNRPT